MPLRLLKHTVFSFRNRTWFIALFEGVLVFCSLLLAWVIRFEFELPNPLLLFSAAPLLVIIRVIISRCFNLLHGWWHYTGINEAVNILKAVAVGSVVFVIVVRYVLGVTLFPISIYFLEMFLSLGLLGGVRLIARVVAESVREGPHERKQVMVIGAGFAAGMVIREMKRPNSGYLPIACLDDDRSKHGISVQGVPVVGAVEHLPQLRRQYLVDEALIAIPSATGVEMRRIVELCEAAELKYKTVPALRELISGQAVISQVRNVHVDDLLGRDKVKIDLEAVRNHVSGKVVMVTGAAGSIGSELCKQLLEYGPSQLLCVDFNENGTFYLEIDLAPRARDTQVHYFVADIGDRERMKHIFSRFQVDVVYHAAAHKHVPVMESNVHQAVNNNVFGLLCLLHLADHYSVKGFVLISSDKAVNPTSVMGCTKRVCELIIASRPTRGLRCVSVRFGNVLGSNGSVVPLFQQQMETRGEITLTHRDIRRFFMAISEAVSLVLQASVIGLHRDVLVLDMGEPVRIMDLAHTLIKLSGRTLDQIQIRETGLRSGEKLKEELFYESEDVAETSFSKIKRTSGQIQDWSLLQAQLDELRASMSNEAIAPVLLSLKRIVPDYSGLPEKTPLSESILPPSAMKASAGRPA
jgi:FlaA1/EpsC-like NDP-sugar epimerase